MNTNSQCWAVRIRAQYAAAKGPPSTRPSWGSKDSLFLVAPLDSQASKAQVYYTTDHSMSSISDWSTVLRVWCTIGDQDRCPLCKKNMKIFLFLVSGRPHFLYAHRKSIFMRNRLLHEQHSWLKHCADDTLRLWLSLFIQAEWQKNERIPSST